MPEHSRMYIGFEASAEQHATLGGAYRPSMSTQWTFGTRSGDRVCMAMNHLPRVIIPAECGRDSQKERRDFVAARPPSLSFELRTKRVSGYSEQIPYLEYTGIADVTSMDVFDASKIEDRKPGTLTNAESAREWLLGYFEQCHGAPQKIREVEAAAQKAGRWFSKGTFERARNLAGVEALQTAELKGTLGEEFDWLSSEDRPHELDGSFTDRRLPTPHAVIPDRQTLLPELLPGTGSTTRELGSPNGIRTRVSTLRGWCPRPLDDGTGHVDACSTGAGPRRV